jgi:hypothetical protein
VAAWPSHARHGEQRERHHYGEQDLDARQHHPRDHRAERLVRK